MIQINNLKMEFGDRVLFENVNFNLDPGNCYGIVGANGSGKSTFLKILSKTIHSTAGEINFPSKTTLGFLKQNQFEYENDVIIDVVLMGRPELYKILKERDQINSKSTVSEDDGLRLADIEHHIARMNGYQASPEASRILEGLGIETESITKPMSTLSGGYKLRVLLAQCLFSQPDILLLDEPNNHLDIYSIAWLENYLAGFQGIIAVVSHDHQFLNRISTHILDIDYEEIILYKGNYHDFEKAKQLNKEQREKEIERQEKKQEELREFYEKFKAKATKARQAVSRKKQLENMEEIVIKRSSRRTPHFNFKPLRPSGQNVLSVEDLSKSFGDNHVLKDVSIEVDRGDKIAIIGPNGIGKSTLLKILTDNLKADSGNVKWGYEAQIGYFSQNHKDLIPDGSTPLGWLSLFHRGATLSQTRGLLGSMLFSGDDVEKRTEALSGGEAARLLFARLIALQPNILALDEPTNHLDLESIEALSDALVSYSGTLLLVSHDRYFVEKVATKILELHHDGFTYYQGRYSSFMFSKGEDYFDPANKLAKAKAAEEPKIKQKSKEEVQARRQLIKNQSRLEKQVKKLEEKIDTLEHEIEAIQHKLDHPEQHNLSHYTDLAKTMEEKETLEAKLDEVMENWEDAQSEFDKVQQKILDIDGKIP